MSETLRELRGLSDDEIIARHDKQAKTTQVGVNYYLNELARRDQDRQTRAMLKYTRWVTLMTSVITIMTIVMVIATIANFLKEA